MCPYYGDIIDIQLASSYLHLPFLLKELVNLTSVLRVANMMPMHMYPKIEDPITIAAIEKSNNGPWHDLTDVSYNMYA